MSRPGLDRVFAAGVSSLVQGGSRDLTMRQMLVLLTLDLVAGPHTVRGLALRLKVAKPVVVRALDRLCAEGLAHRYPDPHDRRSVIVALTPDGARYLRRLTRTLRRAAAAAEGGPGSSQGAFRPL